MAPNSPPPPRQATCRCIRSRRGRRRHPRHQGNPRRPRRQSHHPDRRHPERHLQLHPDRNAGAWPGIRRRSSPTRRNWVTPKPTRPSTSTASTPRTNLAILAALAFGRPVAFWTRFMAEGIRRTIRPRHRLRHGTRLPHRKLLGIASHTECRRSKPASTRCMVLQSAPIRARVDGVFQRRWWPRATSLAASCWKEEAPAPVQLPRPWSRTSIATSPADPRRPRSGRRRRVTRPPPPSVPMSAAFPCPYYIRLMVVDRPGVIRADASPPLCATTASPRESMLQRGRSPGRGGAEWCW